MREGEIVVDVVDYLLGQCEDDDLTHHFCGQFTTVQSVLRITSALSSGLFGLN